MAASTRVFTPQQIDALKPKGKTYNSRKEDNIYLRVYPSGKRCWMLEYNLDKRRRRLKLGDYSGTFKLAAARKERNRLMQLVEQSVDPKAEIEQRSRERQQKELQTVYFQKWLDIYLSDRQIISLKTSGERERALKRHFTRWNTCEVQNITRIMVNMELDRIKAPSMKGHALAYIRHFFNWCISKGVMDTNPCTQIKVKKEKARQNFLSDDEIKDFWNGLADTGMEPQTQGILKLLLITGQRLSEVVNMKKDDIEGNWWTLPETKNGKPQRVYLLPEAHHIISKSSELSNCQYVFTHNNKTPVTTTGITRACTRYSKGAYTPHDLRRTITTNLGKLGFNRFTQRLILNHTDNSIDAVYDIYSYDKERIEASKAWLNQIKKISNQRTTNAKP